MTPERYAEVRKKYFEVQALPSSERDSYLERLRRSDPGVAREVARILEFDRYELTVGSLLPGSCSPPDPGPEAASGIPAEVSSGRVRYRVVRELGRGGMGVVYEAEQSFPARSVAQRSVALKVIASRIASETAVRRFELEAEALARLQHPSIAQIYEAGFLDDSEGPRPFFAMEFVQGVRLDDHAKESDRSTTLDVFRQIAEAVHHAHCRGVIHRDLKPGNILIDERGRPKVLDFGVARLTGGSRDSLLETEPLHLLGTLPYMSPEQVAHDTREIDVRSDVYSLGVILFELLSGRLPFLLEETPLPQAVLTICADRAPLLGRVDPSLRGDLETIVAKALEKERDRRYDSALALADDIRRFLHHEPIEARPASARYQLKMFARRHRGLSVAIAAVMLGLLAGLIGLGWGAREARREAALSRAMAEYLETILVSATPRHGGAEPPSLVDVLDSAAGVLGGRTDDDPALAAWAHRVVGSSYANLARLEEAEYQLRRALSGHESLYGPEDPRAIAVASDLATVLTRRGRVDEATRMATRAHDRAVRSLGVDHPETLSALEAVALARIDAADLDGAEIDLRDCLARGRSAIGPQDPLTLQFQHNLATCLFEASRYRDAEVEFQSVYDARRAVRGEDDPDTLASLHGLASTKLALDRRGEGRALLEELIARQDRVYGPDHLAALATRNVLAVSCRQDGDLERAAELLREVVAGRRSRLGADHEDTLGVMNNLAVVLMFQGEEAEFRALSAEILERSAPGSRSRILALNTEGRHLDREGRYPEAAERFRQAMELAAERFDPDHIIASVARFKYGRCLARIGRTDDARRLLESARDALRRIHGEGAPARGRGRAAAPAPLNRSPLTRKPAHDPAGSHALPGG